MPKKPAPAKAAKKQSAKKNVRKAAKPPAKKAKRPAAKKPARRSPLPRPKVTGEELLFLLFKEDYYARQVFDYLRVETVKELEQFSPGQITERVSRPVHEAVERIRRHLAEKNRYLAGDEEYLRKHLAAATERA